ncbi:ABC transporter substrate-binding protein [uncultured Cohaesibacter sp.]|uniref:ABC transporter substrate-binding protein n=1 Tax=uncultured Cohaesibacter sp. TaxID=1002546 RepID=UPI0029C927F7|nr:ABC transporter substrate-binding protein [uncultured Cohaesibacter sp.]
MVTKTLCTFAGVAALFAANSAFAAPTSYPLTVDNCGQSVTFSQAPQRAVALGQNSAEILLLLGLEDRLAASAFWPTKVLPELEKANEKVTLLTVEAPTLEAILAQKPDFVTAALPNLMGPNSKVSKREDFAALDIPTYISPSVCATKKDTGDAHGSRDALWSMDLLYQEIDELARIFDVADRGKALISDFRAREAALRKKFTSKADLSFLFWFSSPSVEDNAYLGGGFGPSAYIADLLGGHNAINTSADWPTVGWEGIIAANPTVFVVAELDRNRWELDKAAAKIKYLTTDPTVSKMPAVAAGRIVTMNGAAMNPSIRTIYGAEEIARQLETIKLPQ